MPAGPGIGGNNVVGEAWVNLGVNPKKFNQGLNMAMGGLAKFAAIAAPLAAGVGLALGFKKAVSAAGDFQQSMAMVKAVTLSSVKDLEKQSKLFDQLSNKAKLIGKTTKWQMTEIAEGMENLGRAGFSAVEVMDAIAGVSDLAASQMMELSDAADITAMILRSMAMDASKAGEVADVLAYAASNSAARVQGLGEAYKYVGPLAQAFGSSTQEVTGMMMKLADAGIRGSMAGTGLRMAYSELLGMTQSFRTKLKAVGITANQLTKANGSMMSLTEIFGAFEEAGLGTSDMIQLFGKRAGPAMAILLREGEDALRDYTDALDEAGGTAQEMREIMEGTLQGQTTILSGSWTLLMTTIGEKAIPVFQDLLQNTLIPTVNKMVDWAETSGDVERAMKKVANGIKSSLEWIINNGDDLIRILKGIGTALLVMTGAKILTGLVSLASNLSSLGAIIMGLNPTTLLAGLGLAGAAGLYKMGKAIYDGIADGLTQVKKEAIDLANILNPPSGEDEAAKWQDYLDVNAEFFANSMRNMIAASGKNGLQQLNDFAEMMPQIQAMYEAASGAPDMATGSAKWIDLINQFAVSWIGEYPQIGRLITTDVEGSVVEGFENALRQIQDLFPSVFSGALELPPVPLLGPRATGDTTTPEEEEAIVYLQKLKDEITGADSITEAMRLATQYANEFGMQLKPLAEATEDAGPEFSRAAVEFRDSLELVYQTALKENEAAKAFGLAPLHTEEELERLATFLKKTADEAEEVSVQLRTLSDKMATFSSAFGRMAKLLLGSEIGGHASSAYGVAQKAAEAMSTRNSMQGMDKGSAEYMAAEDAAAGQGAAAAAAFIEMVIDLIEQGVQFVKDSLSEAGQTAIAFAQSIWNAITATEAWSDMMSGLQSAMTRLMNAILTPLQLLGELFNILGGKVIEVTSAVSAQTEATEDSMSNLNVPHSWREDRVRWAAIRPGETPRDYGTDTDTTQDSVDQELTWLEGAIEQFRGLFQHHLDWFGDFVTRMRNLGLDLFPSILMILEGPLTTLERALDGIATWLEDVFAEDLKTFSEGFLSWWQTDVDPFLEDDVFKFFGDAFTAVYEWIKGTFLPFLKNELWPAFKTDVWPAVKDALTQLGQALSDLFTTVDENMPTITQFLTDFFTGIIDKWTGMVETVNAYTLTRAGDLAGGLKVIWESESLSLWDKTKATIGLGAIAVWDLITKAFEPLKEPLAALGSALGKLWEKISPLLIPALEAVIGIIQIGLMGALWVLTAAVKIVSGIFDIIGFVLKAFANIVIFVANAFIGIGNVFRSSKNDKPYIPYLASGGNILSDGLAYVHAGETVLNAALAEPLSAGIGSGGGELHVYLGNEEVTDMVVTEVRRESGRKYGKTHTSRMFGGR